MMDDDNDNIIGPQNLKSLCRELGETLSLDEIVDMISAAGSTDEASLSFEDFMEIMNKREFA